MPNHIPAHPSVSAPEERPYKVYSFSPAGLLPGGSILEAFWAEECACPGERQANTIRNLLQMALPGIRYVVGTEVPKEIPDHNVYGVDGKVVQTPEPKPDPAKPSPTKPKVLRTQKVVAVLRAAGHQSVGKLSWCEEIQGYRFERDGFQVSGKDSKPYVAVSHTFAVKGGPDWRQIATAKCLEYKGTLEAAGLAVTANEWNGHINWLEVRYPKDAGQE